MALATDILPVRPSDPAQLTWPPTLAVEVALRTATITEICGAYGIDRRQWMALRLDQRFQAEVRRWLDVLKVEGMSFKLKARLQAEAMLQENWRLVHASSAEVPPAVKADLIKHTIRIAGLDASKEQERDKAFANALQININL